MRRWKQGICPLSSTTDFRALGYADIFKAAVGRFLDEAHFCMPARVVAYYPEQRKVDVQPLPKMIFPGMTPDQMFDIPVLWSVPIVWPSVDSTTEGGPKAIIYMPIMKGSIVLLVFSDYSIDNWVQSAEGMEGQTYDHQDTRRHDINDAFAIPGIMPYISKVAATDSSKGTATSGALVDPHDIRIVLEWPDKNIRSEFYLGGDTGDIVAYPQRNVALGIPNAGNIPVPQQPLKTWLEAILGQLESLCDTLSGATVGGAPFDGTTPADILAIKAQLISLMKRFDGEDPPAAQNSFGVTTSKVKIP